MVILTYRTVIIIDLFILFYKFSKNIICSFFCTAIYHLKKLNAASVRQIKKSNILERSEIDFSKKIQTLFLNSSILFNFLICNKLGKQFDT